MAYCITCGELTLNTKYCAKCRPKPKRRVNFKRPKRKYKTTLIVTKFSNKQCKFCNAFLLKTNDKKDNTCNALCAARLRFKQQYNGRKIKKNIKKSSK